MKIAYYFKKLDRLSEGPTLTVDGNSRFQTKRGATCTLLAYFVFLSAAFYMVIDFQKRKVLGSMSNTLQIAVEEYDNNKMDVAKSKLMPLIKPGAFWNDKVFDPEQIYSLEFEYLFYHEHAINSGGHQEATNYTTKFTNCSRLSDHILRKYYIDRSLFKIDLYYCVDVEKIEDAHAALYRNNGYKFVPPLTISHSKSNTLKVKVLPCNRDLNAKCAQLNETRRDQFLTGTNSADHFSIVSVMTLVNLENYENPLRFSIVGGDRAVRLTKSGGYRFATSLSPTYIKDELGFPFSKNISGSFASKTETTLPAVGGFIPLTCSEATKRDAKLCPSYYENNININEDKGIVKLISIQRKFKTLSEVVSEIGGMYSGIWLGVSFIYSLLFEGVGKYNIVEKMFGLKEAIICFCIKRLTRRSMGIDGSSYLVTPRVFKAAKAVIEESLDVYSLVQQLALLKLFLNFAFNKESKKSGLRKLLQLKLAEISDHEMNDLTSALPNHELDMNRDSDPNAGNNIFFKEDPFEDKDPPFSSLKSKHHQVPQVKTPPEPKDTKHSDCCARLREYLQIAISNHQAKLSAEGERVLEEDDDSAPSIMNLNALNTRLL